MKIFSTKNLKIARESLNIDSEKSSPSDGQQQHEWRKLVGSIRRRVQRHASSSSSTDQSSSTQALASPTQSRKNSLTQGKLFRKEKSKDDSVELQKESKNEGKVLTRQKSIEATSSKTDYFKALTFRDRSKSASVKHVDSLAAPTSSNKGVRKSEKTRDSDKTHKSSFRCSKISKSGSQKRKEDRNVNKDDFLKATMRIFLVVSPPVGKMQVNV